MVENKFLELNSNEMEEVNGGSLSLGAALLISAGVIFLVSAACELYNGYQEEKRACR